MTGCFLEFRFLQKKCQGPITLNIKEESIQHINYNMLKLYGKLIENIYSNAFNLSSGQDLKRAMN